MSDSNLTQDDIDKLLTDVDDINEEPIVGTATLDRDELIKETEISKFKQIVTQILDIATTLFQGNYKKNINYSQVRSFIKDHTDIRNEFQTKTFIQVTITYTSGIVGEMVYLISITEGLKLAEYLTGQTFKEINEASLTTISNIVATLNKSSLELLRTATGSDEFLSTSPRTEIIETSARINFPGSGSQAVLVSYKLNPDLHPPIDLQFYQLISVPMAKEFIKIQERGGEIDWKMSDEGDESGKKGVNIRPVKYSPLDLVPIAEKTGDIGLLIDITMNLTVELGQTRCRVKEILGWGEGSIVELTKHAGEPVDILVNGKLIAKGEVVVIDENFGVRVTEVVSGSNRLESLK